MPPCVIESRICPQTETPMKTILCLSALFAVLASSLFAQDVTLKPGDDAPAITASEWLKGDEVKSFKKDQVYVMEFWATWCGPCVAVIPHLSELQDEHKDVTFIGMNIFERDPDKARAFVKKMGDKMDYTVALQDGEKMADNWMKAAGQGGIPCSFVIDQDGKIAWIGHPMAMEPVLEAVIKKEFDIEAHAKLEKRKNNTQRKMAEAFRDEEWDAGLKHLDALVKIDPSMASRANMTKFKILLGQKKDADAAYEIAKDFPEQFKDDEMLLNESAWFIVDEKDLPRRDLDLAMKLAARGVALTERKEAAVLDTLARVHWEKDQIGKAIKIQTEAVKVAEDPRMKADLKKTLDKYLEDETL